MFDPLFDGLAQLLNFSYRLIPDYAGAIALLTVFVMIVLFPLNAKSQRSMAAMAKLQPELKRIQAKHKDDKQRQTEETMALFKEHGASPAGGCLPLLVQGPVLFIMYRIIFGLTRKGADGTFDPQYLDDQSVLYRALDQAREMNSIGLDLAKTASEAARASFLGAMPFFLLIALCVGTGYYQQRQISRRNPQGAGADDNPIAKQMQMMTKIFPLMYLVFGFTLPAGMLVYFLVSNVFRIGQQSLIYKLDPSLLPNPGEKTIEAKSSPKAPDAKPERKADDAPSTNGRAKGKASSAPPAKRNPNTSKKKKRR